MDRPPSTVSWKRLLSKLWWKHNWKWAVPVAGLALLLFGPVLLVVIPLVYLGVRQSRKHTAKLRHVCEVLGFAFEDTEVRELGARFGDFPHFALSGGTGRGLMTGSLAEHPVTVMEHFYGPRAKYRETLAVFPDGAKGLPDFELSPGGGRVLEKIGAALGLQDINFPENEAFSNRYALRGTDEEAIRQAFSATTLAFFAANQGWSVQAHRGALTIYRSSTLYAPAQVPSFLAEALTVFGAFDTQVSPGGTPPSAIARTPPGPDVRALTPAPGMTSRRKLSVLAVTALSLYFAMCYSLMAEVDTLRCDRTADVCTLRYDRARSAKVQQFPLHGLTGAELRLSRRSSKSGDRSATVVLLTEDGPIPFMTYSSGVGKSEMSQQVAEVERFLATPSMQRLQLRRDNRVSSSLVAAFPSLLGAAMFLLVYVMRRGRKKHIEGLRQVCEALGFKLEEGPIHDLGERFGRFSCFSRKEGIHQGRGLMTGSRAGHPVTVMDHFHGTGSETVAVFPEGARGLPDFELSTSGAVGETIFATLGEPDINFPENLEFSRRYELRGTDQAAIRAAFATKTLTFFTENHGWSVQTLGGAAIIFRASKRCAPAEVPRFLAEALTVLGALTPS